MDSATEMLPDKTMWETQERHFKFIFSFGGAGDATVDNDTKRQDPRAWMNELRQLLLAEIPNFALTQIQVVRNDTRLTHYKVGEKVEWIVLESEPLLRALYPGSHQHANGESNTEDGAPLPLCDANNPLTFRNDPAIPPSPTPLTRTPGDAGRCPNLSLPMSLTSQPGQTHIATSQLTCSVSDSAEVEHGDGAVGGAPLIKPAFHHHLFNLASAVNEAPPVIHIEAQAALGYGAHHAKWSHFANAGVYDMATVKVDNDALRAYVAEHLPAFSPHALVNSCPVRVFDIEDLGSNSSSSSSTAVNIRVVNSDACIMCNKCTDYLGMTQTVMSHQQSTVAKNKQDEVGRFQSLRKRATRVWNRTSSTTQPLAAATADERGDVNESVLSSPHHQGLVVIHSSDKFGLVVNATGSASVPWLMHVALTEMTRRHPNVVFSIQLQ